MPWTPTRYGLPSPGPHDEVEPFPTMIPASAITFNVKPNVELLRDGRKQISYEGQELKGVWLARLTFSDLRGE